MLRLPFNASPEDVREAYFEAARRYHPDANPSKEAKKLFLQIQEAYEILSNPAKRSSYDTLLPEEMRQTAAIGISTYYGRTAIPKLTEQQLFYVLLEIECTKELEVKDLPPVHLCLVLDRSNSMRGERMDMVRANISEMIRKLRPKDTLSIVAFSDRAEVIVPAKDLSEIYAIESALNQMPIGGATEIFRGLEAGVEMIRRFSRNTIFKHLILITDGHTYGDEEACVELANGARVEGISINALGIGDEWNDSFLDRLAVSGGGNAVYVKTAEDLFGFIEQKLNSIQVNYARNVEMDFNLDEKVEMQLAFRIQPEVTPLEMKSPLPLGSIEYGKKTSIILEFKISPIEDNLEDYIFLRGKLLMEVPSLPIDVGRFPLKLRRPVRDQYMAERPPTAILQAMSRLTLYRLQEKARMEVNAGNIPKATRHLQHLATHLLSRGERELAKSVLIEAEHIQRTHHFSREGDKKIKYGTRALLQLPQPESNT